MADPFTIGMGVFKIGASLFGRSKKRKARKLQARANAIRNKSALLSNAVRRTMMAKSFLAAQAEGKVASQQAGGTLAGSAVQGNISGGRAAFAGNLSDALVTERMGQAINQLDSRAASELYKASRFGDIAGAVGIVGGEFSDWWQSRGVTPKTTTYAPSKPLEDN